MNKEEIISLLKIAKQGRILVVGGGVTGSAAAKLFDSSNYKTCIVDEKSLPEKLKSELPDVQFIEDYKVSSENFIKLKNLNFTFALFSPGINPRSLFAKQIIDLEIPIFTELDIALPFIGMPLIAVTGTNGKTTVVTLINDILAAAGKKSELVGNVGFSFLSKIGSLDVDRGIEFSQAEWVSELSSYQLEGVKEFRPKITMMLNVDDDHLERHGNLNGYIEAKARIFKWQQSANDWSIINADEFWSEQVSKVAKGKIFYFGYDKKNNTDGCYYNSADNKIIFRLDNVLEEYSLDKSRLLGKHNKLNIAACISAARLAGVEKSVIQNVIENFQPLEHRIEYVREVDGVTYINDSKGTNVSAVMVALDMIEHEYPIAKVTLLLGGKIKEGSWKHVENRLGEQIRSVICFGADRELVAERLNLKAKHFPVFYETGLGSAMEKARAVSKNQDVVILSPGCASFDAYSGFAERGRHFKEIVNSFK